MPEAPQFSQYYQLNDRIAKGSFSTIYTCTKRGTGDVYVVRVIDKSGLDAAQLKRLEDEISLLRAARHERVVGFLERFDSPNSTYIVLEAVSGGTLLDSVAYTSVYNEGVVLNIIYNILLALQHLHHRNIVHRNVALDSILVRLRVPGDTPSTVDPATLAVLFKQHDNFAILPGDVMIGGTAFASIVPPEGLSICCGTPQYIAPEMIDAGVYLTPPDGVGDDLRGEGSATLGPGKSTAVASNGTNADEAFLDKVTLRPTAQSLTYGVAVDMWSVGVAAYILLCGYAPFRGRSLSQLFARIKSGQYVFASSPRSAWCGVSEEARDFVARLLVVNPESRLTVDEALRHPWLGRRASVQNDSHFLTTTQFNLQIFAARKAFPAAVFGIEASARRRYLVECKRCGVKPNSGIMQLLEEAAVSRAERGKVLSVESPAGGYAFGTATLLANDSPSTPKPVPATPAPPTDPLTKAANDADVPSESVNGKLLVLNLDNNLLKGRSFDAFVAWLATKGDVVSLSLRAHQLAPEGIRTLCAALSSHPSLQHLVLDDNMIGYQGAKRLLDLLHRNPRISRVSLNGCHVHPAKVAAIAERAAANAGVNDRAAAGEVEAAVNAAALRSRTDASPVAGGVSPNMKLFGARGDSGESVAVVDGGASAASGHSGRSGAPSGSTSVVNSGGGSARGAPPAVSGTSSNERRDTDSMLSFRELSKSREPPAAEASIDAAMVDALTESAVSRSALPEAPGRRTAPSQSASVIAARRNQSGKESAGSMTRKQNTHRPVVGEVCF